METRNHLEPGAAWADAGVDSEEWAGLQSLLELVRREHMTELGPERRAQIRARVMARLDRHEAWRRRWRAFVAGAATLLVVGLMIAIYWGWSGPEVTGRSRRYS